jgi:cytoskeleton protein RodZ
MSTIFGQQLRQARQARSLTLEQIAQTTRIRVHYLQALEAGDLTSLPSMAQARGFLRAYASYLKLDSDALLASLDRNNQNNASDVEQGELIPAQVASPTSADASPVETTPAYRSQDQDAKTQPIGSRPFPPQPSQPVAVRTASGQSKPGRPQFIEVGERLQRQRELLGLSLDDVERHTHLRQHYLRALETGDLEGLPSPVQGRGMLNNYAAFLGLDPESLLLLFAEGLQASLEARQAIRQEAHPAPVRHKPWLPTSVRRIFSSDILIGGTLVIFLVVFAGWGAIRIFTVRTEQTPTVTAPSIADVLLASSTPTTTFTPAPAAPTVHATLALLLPISTGALSGGPLPSNAQGKVQIYITVLQRAWMRVTVDGKIEFEGRVIPGSAYPFVGESQVEILTGNGAAIQVFFNQQDLGEYGGFGQVVDRIFTLQGILYPTPTVTPTPSATLPATAAPPATATPRPGQATPPALP